MKPETWKVLAWIFIILFILENLFVGYGMILVNHDTANENECIYNVCDNSSAYYYDTTSSMCYCYDNGEIASQKFLG